MTIGQREKHKSPVRQAAKAFLTLGLSAGLAACSSTMVVETAKTDAKAPPKPVNETVTARKAAAPKPRTIVSSRSVRDKSETAQKTALIAKRPVATASKKSNSKTKGDATTRADVPSALTSRSAGETALVAETTRPGTTTLSAARSPEGTVRGSRPAPAYHTRSAFPTAPAPRSVFGEESTAKPEPKFRSVPIFWATNRGVEPPKRRQIESQYEAVAFAAKRADDLTKGLALVTIPKVKRNVGDIPRPKVFRFLGFRIYRENEDPEKHFTIRSLVRFDDDTFLKFAKANLDKARDFKGHCFVYVHGYRNTFDDAIYRAAQIAVDMGFDGNAFVYSWPSQGNFAGYIADRDAVDASQPHFQKFLTFLNDETTCNEVHVLAHSMGTRLVVDAFFPPVGQGALNTLPKIGQIVLASPDIDASILRSRADAIRQSPRTITLYANGHDDALQWSKTAAGGFVRAGDVIDGKPLVIEGVDTIDLTPMSHATWVFIGANHNEYAERAHILQDIALLMRHGVRPPEKRFPIYAAQRLDDGMFWRYVTN